MQAGTRSVATKCMLQGGWTREMLQWWTGWSCDRRAHWSVATKCVEWTHCVALQWWIGCCKEVLQRQMSCCKVQVDVHEGCCNGGLGGVAMKVKGHGCNTAGWVLLQWQTDRAWEMHINGRLLQWQKDCVAMVDRMLQDAGGRRVAILTSEWTTMNSTTPKYSSYRMCCNKPSGTSVVLISIPFPAHVKTRPLYPFTSQSPPIRPVCCATIKGAFINEHKLLCLIIASNFEHVLQLTFFTALQCHFWDLYIIRACSSTQRSHTFFRV